MPSQNHSCYRIFMNINPWLIVFKVIYGLISGEELHSGGGVEDGGWGACILREFCISNMFWLMTEHLEKHPKKCIAKKLQNYGLSFKHKTNLNQTPHFFSISALLDFL